LPADPAKLPLTQTEPLRLVLRQLPLVLVASSVNAVIVAVTFEVTSFTGVAAGWATIIIALSALRLRLALRRRALPMTSVSIHRLSRWLLAESALSGAAWGAGPVIFFPPDIAKQVFLAFAIGGMVAGAAVTLTSLLPIFRVFVLLSVPPFALRLLWEGSSTAIAMAAMLGVFAIALYIVGTTLNRSLMELLQSQVERDALVARLSSVLASKFEAEGQLHQSQKMLAIGQLTSGLAHDFNNFLTVVIGNLALVLERVRGEERLEHFINAATMAAERCERITKQLLAFARRQQLDPAPVDVAGLVEQISELLRRTVRQDHRLEFRFPPDMPLALVDANQLQTAVLNLVLNARDATPSGGTISLSATRTTLSDPLPVSFSDLMTGDYVDLIVADNGAGMSTAVMDRVFEPFFTTKEEGKGTGLGLSMVYGFARQSGGAVHIESVEGEGTAVHLLLPAALPV
jgi:signal transduction histidine kinase